MNAATGRADGRTHPARATLAWLGEAVGTRVRFVLQLMALAFGMIVEALSRRSWRRTSRAEFARLLNGAILGSLPATLFVAVLAGVGMVYQSMYWLRVAGEADLIGTVLVVILVREVAPILVGAILLGRSASAMLAELCQLQSERQLHAMQAQGIDPFQVLIMPRGIAFALAAYALGMIFVLVTLVTGFIVANLLGVVPNSIWHFFDTVLRAAAPSDFVVFPLKMLLIGDLIGASACLTALLAAPGERVGRLISRGFIRGMLALLLTTGLLGVAA